MMSIYDAARPGEGQVAIYRLLKDTAFDDTAVKAMTTAYEAVLPELGLVDRSDPLTDIVARKILEIFQAGERDPDRLCERTVEEIRG
jgi:hypothetical protein